MFSSLCCRICSEIKQNHPHLPGRVLFTCEHLWRRRPFWISTVLSVTLSNGRRMNHTLLTQLSRESATFLRNFDLCSFAYLCSIVCLRAWLRGKYRLWCHIPSASVDTRLTLSHGANYRQLCRLQGIPSAGGCVRSQQHVDTRWHSITWTAVSVSEPCSPTQLLTYLLNFILITMSGTF